MAKDKAEKSSAMLQPRKPAAVQKQRSLSVSSKQSVNSKVAPSINVQTSQRLVQTVPRPGSSSHLTAVTAVPPHGDSKATTVDYEVCELKTEKVNIGLDALNAIHMNSERLRNSVDTAEQELCALEQDYEDNIQKHGQLCENRNQLLQLLKPITDTLCAKQPMTTLDLEKLDAEITARIEKAFKTQVHRLTTDRDKEKRLKTEFQEQMVLEKEKLSLDTSVGEMADLEQQLSQQQFEVDESMAQYNAAVMKHKEEAQEVKQQLGTANQKYEKCNETVVTLRRQLEEFKTQSTQMQTMAKAEEEMLKKVLGKLAEDLKAVKLEQRSLVEEAAQTRYMDVELHSVVRDIVADHEQLLPNSLITVESLTPENALRVAAPLMQAIYDDLCSMIQQNEELTAQQEKLVESEKQCQRESEDIRTAMETGEKEHRQRLKALRQHKNTLERDLGNAREALAQEEIYQHKQAEKTGEVLRLYKKSCEEMEQQTQAWREKWQREETMCNKLSSDLDIKQQQLVQLRQDSARRLEQQKAHLAEQKEQLATQAEASQGLLMELDQKNKAATRLRKHLQDTETNQQRRMIELDKEAEDLKVKLLRNETIYNELSSNLDKDTAKSDDFEEKITDTSVKQQKLQLAITESEETAASKWTELKRLETERAEFEVERRRLNQEQTQAAETRLKLLATSISEDLPEAKIKHYENELKQLQDMCEQRRRQKEKLSKELQIVVNQIAELSQPLPRRCEQLLSEEIKAKEKTEELEKNLAQNQKEINALDKSTINYSELHQNTHE